MKKLLSNPIFIAVVSLLIFLISYVITKKVSTALLLSCGTITVYGSYELLSDKKIEFPILTGVIAGISCIIIIAMLKLKFL